MSQTEALQLIFKAFGLLLIKMKHCRTEINAKICKSKCPFFFSQCKKHLKLPQMGKNDLNFLMLCKKFWIDFARIHKESSNLAHEKKKFSRV